MIPALIEVYGEQTLLLAQQTKYEAAENYLLRIARYRADPDEENNELRVRLLMRSGRHKNEPFYIRRMEELRYGNGLTMTVKLRLLLSGYYGFFYPVFCIVIIVLAVMLVVKLLFGARALVSWLDEYYRYDPERMAKRDAKIAEKAKKRGVGYGQLVTEPDEYSRLLGLLGLDDSATEDEIKHAYRQRMKESHPDVSPDKGAAPGDTVDNFIELKGVYDRIMEIRKSWFGGR